MTQSEHIATLSERAAKLVDPVSRIVRQAGRLMRSERQDQWQVEQKSAANYVTEVDLAVQQQVLAALFRLTPEYAVIAEESDVNQYGLSEPTWILDPVDGTTNLMRGYRHCAVSLALAGPSGLLLGFVYNPFADELFTAVAAQGAWLNGHRIQTGPHTQLADCLVGFGTTPYDRTCAHLTFAVVEHVFHQSLEIRRSGAAALDLSYVACGRLDAFFELNLQPWDYAAGSLILEEAGGRITNWTGDKPNLRRSDSILATNGCVHQDLLALIRQHTQPGQCSASAEG